MISKERTNMHIKYRSSSENKKSLTIGEKCSENFAFVNNLESKKKKKKLLDFRSVWHTWKNWQNIISSSSGVQLFNEIMRGIEMLEEDGVLISSEWRIVGH